MAKVNLSGMSVEALMDLRKRVDETLHQHRAKLQQQLERMEVGGARVVGGGGSALKSDSPDACAPVLGFLTTQRIVARRAAYCCGSPTPCSMY